MPSALLPARDIRLPPPEPEPQQGANAHHDDHDSHSHSEDGESHSSHSSYQRRHAPPDAPPPPTSLGPPTLAALSLVFLLLLYHLFGLALFTRGFLLTRRQLDGIRSQACTTPAAASYIPTPPAGYHQGADLDPYWSALGHGGSNEQQAECTMPASHTFDRAVVLIIDALRYDFLAPINNNSSSITSADAEWRPHPYQHGHLSLPAELLRIHPSHSFLSHFHADPPTTTLQRIKGLTTGTLPTFIDASANFGGGQRIEEDNWIDQLRDSSGKSGSKVIFAGDDTWMGLFPNTFDRATPFDSFNVHDLDTVDRGVRRVLEPYLRRNGPNEPNLATTEEDWRLLLLHNLGLDHAGHRFSSTHPSIKRKLLETNELVEEIINNLAKSSQQTRAAQPRTLFVLLGDHGMDPQGDHGGDAELEVGAGLFIWSGGGQEPVTFASEGHPDIRSLLSSTMTSSNLVPPSRLPFSTLGPASLTHRSVAQIDLVPSLSLLMGLPIPFNSLGTVIPELFAAPSLSHGAADPGTDLLLRALRLNAHQIRRYFQTYSSRGNNKKGHGDGGGGGGGGPNDMSTSGGLGGEFESEIDRLWAEARKADAYFASVASAAAAASSSSPSAAAMTTVDEARRAASSAYFAYTRASLTHARSVWATFDMDSMLKGLTLLAVGLAAIVAVVLGELGKEERVGVIGDGLALVSEDEKGQDQAGMVRVSRRVWRRAIRAFVAGAVVSLPVWAGLASVQNSGLIQRGWSVLESTMYSGALLSGLALALGPVFSSSTSALFPRSAPASFKASYQALGRAVSTSHSTLLLIGPALVHAALFASNSTILREDFIVLLGLGTVLLGMFLSLASRLPRTSTASASLQHSVANEAGVRMSRRDFVLVKAAVLGAVILACARMGRYGSLCREEHGPMCVSNFYASVPQPRVSMPSAAGGIKFGDTGGSGAVGLQSADVKGEEALHVLAPHMSVAGGLAAVAEGGATNSIPSILFAYLCALFLPSILQTLLVYARFSGERSASTGGTSNVGVAPRFLNWVVRPALLAGAGHWAADRLAGDAGSSAAAAAAAATAAKGAAEAAASEISSTAEWAAFGAIFVGRCAAVFLVVATLFWLLAPLCIELRQVDAPGPAGGVGQQGQQQQQQQRKQVQLLGFGNVFGSTYLLLVSVVFGTLFLTAQPSGQVTLTFSFVGLILLAELSAELRSASASASAEVTSPGSPSPSSTSAEIWSSHAVALLAHNAFFGTGHQATLSAIQWRTAFILTRVVRYPWSPILVVLNALGPLVILPAVGAALVGVLWGLSPKAPVLPPPAASTRADPTGQGMDDDEPPTSAADLASVKAGQERNRKIASAHMYTLVHLTRAILILTLYFQTLTLGSAVWSTQMRRHLMLYKVWTPRFLLAAMAGVGVSVVGALVGIGLVGTVVLAKGAAMFGSRFR